REQSVIQQVPIPFSIHAYRNVCRNLIVLAHNFIIVPVLLALFRIPLDWHVLEIVPGLLLLAINCLWVTLFLGLVSARFRDLPPIVSSVLQILFFVTPILWPIELLGSWQGLAALNPVFAAIDVIRAPLLGSTAGATSWIVLALLTI